jgi:integrase
MHDLDFNRQELTVRNGKGGKDRRTMLPKQLAKKLQIHLEKVRTVHKRDLIDGWGAVQLPYALARKYRNAATEWGWQWVFPQHRRWQDPTSKQQGRHHLDPSLIQKSVRSAVLAAGSWHQQAGQLPQLASFFCHTPIRERTGHSHNSGIDGSQGPKNNNDLYARSQSRTIWLRQPGRFPVKKRKRAAGDNGSV